MDPLVIGAIGTAFGVIITAIGAFIVTVNKQKQSESSEKDKALNAVAFGIIESLKKDLAANAVDVIKLQEDKLNCRERNAALATEIQYEKADNERLRVENEQLRKQLQASMITANGTATKTTF